MTTKKPVVKRRTPSLANVPAAAMQEEMLLRAIDKFNVQITLAKASILHMEEKQSRRYMELSRLRNNGGIGAS